MSWLKRNLFLVIGGVVALAIVAFGGYYTYSNLNQNAEVDAQLSETLGSLTNIYRQVPFPHKTNVDAAQHELGRVHAELAQLQSRFMPATPENVSGLRFRTHLENTVAELRKLAQAHGVTLGKTNFFFSFESLRQKADFSPASFPAFPEQLADIRAICACLFDARIAELSNIRRARVSPDDVPGTSDYSELKVTTNTAVNAGIHPYEVTFMTLSENLAVALRNFEKSPNGLLVKTMHVESVGAPVSEAGMNHPLGAPAGAGPATPANPAIRPPPGRGQPRPPPRAVSSQAGDEALPTVLKEKQFRVTLLVEAIKPLKS